MVRNCEDPVFCLGMRDSRHTDNGRQIVAFYRLFGRTNKECQELLYWETVAVLGSRCRSSSAPTAASRDLELSDVIGLTLVDNSRHGSLLIMVLALDIHLSLITQRNIDFCCQTGVHNLFHSHNNCTTK